MENEKVLYIPLDDRPVNLTLVKDLGGISNIDIITPPKEMLGQFLKKGQCHEISNWLKNTKGQVLLISLDMLLYGGLIASRSSETSKEEALELLKAVREFKEENPKVRIYGFSNIMRLSISISGDESEVWWRKINKYNELRYKIEILGEINLQGNLDKLISEIPENVLNNYLNSRKRNHMLNMEAINLVKDEILDFLIMSQEDCSPYGLHWIEHKIINEEINKYSLKDKIYVYPGADEIGQILLARYINDSTKFYPKVFVAYDNEVESDNIPKFEDRPLKDNINEHLKSLGAIIVDDIESCDLVLAVTTPNMPYIDMAEDSMDNYNKKKIIDDFVSKLNEYYSKGKVIALADLSLANGGDLYLIDRLREDDLLLKIKAYSGWNTAGNALGTAIAHGNIICNLINNGKLNLNSSINSLRFLLERYADDLFYQSIVRRDTAKIVLEENLSIFNMGNINVRVNNYVEKALDTLMKEYFIGRNIDYLEAKGMVSEIDVKAALPWNRVFETECSIKLKLQEV
ncbi:DUF4127 family protein [Clostridium sartagoforme]|uniref:DUF4127 family protein n=1 Tax=Clostridium sartagoforme TaxID=84031 RepID=A0A4S2DM48_9CLOT|nr:DUF4127 family protein [Clostridium sartagoforme]TGY43386.1 DUF4127 family protein [Clostridium sartagoforme]